MFKMLIVLFAVVGLSSCGTVAGLGDDIKSVAKWSEKKMSETEEPKEVNDLPLDTNIVTQEEI
jgi:predicted small secreted protein